MGTVIAGKFCFSWTDERQLWAATLTFQLAWPMTKMGPFAVSPEMLGKAKKLPQGSACQSLPTSKSKHRGMRIELGETEA